MGVFAQPTDSRDSPVYLIAPGVPALQRIWTWVVWQWILSHYCYRYHTASTSHYIDVLMSPIASQITGLSIVYSTVYPGAGQRKHQNSASLSFVRGISLVTGEFPAQRASNAENVSISWRHYVVKYRSRKPSYHALRLSNINIPFIGKSPAAMALITWYKQTLVFHEEGFKLPMTFECLDMIMKQIHLYLHFCQKDSTHYITLHYCCSIYA